MESWTPLPGDTFVPFDCPHDVGTDGLCPNHSGPEDELCIQCVGDLMTYYHEKLIKLRKKKYKSLRKEIK